jgi:hypothetical protein
MYSLNPSCSNFIIDRHSFIIMLACKRVRLIFMLLLDQWLESPLLNSTLTGQSLLEESRIGCSACSRLTLEVGWLNGRRLYAHTIAELTVKRIPCLSFTFSLIYKCSGWVSRVPGYLFRARVIFRTENLIDSFFCPTQLRILRSKNFRNNCSVVGNTVFWPFKGGCNIGIRDSWACILVGGIACGLLLIIIAICLIKILYVSCLGFWVETGCKFRFMTVYSRWTVSMSWRLDCLANLGVVSIEVVAHWAFCDLAITLLEAFSQLILLWVWTDRGNNR